MADRVKVDRQVGDLPLMKSIAATAVTLAEQFRILSQREDAARFACLAGETAVPRECNLSAACIWVEAAHPG